LRQKKANNFKKIAIMLVINDELIVMPV